MAKFAVIDQGIVENCVEADSLEIAEEVTGKTCVAYEDSSMVSPGFTYAGGIFTNPNPTEEEVVVHSDMLIEEGYVVIAPSEE